MLAIIPARGGSKRLPGKNIKLLNGKPLIAYTIESALMCSSIEQVIVSTDDPEILSISKQFGADSPNLRPDYLSHDNSSSNDVIKYTINVVNEVYGKNYENCVLLQPTSPFRSCENIDDAVSLFRQNNALAVISICKENHPIKWHKYLNNSGILESINFEEKLTYYPNGSIYVLSKEVINNNNYYTDKTFGYLMDKYHSVDIDTQDDWDYAEYLMLKKGNQNY